MSLSDPETLQYYKDEPTFSLYISQMDDASANQSSIVDGDECMMSADGGTMKESLYKSSQNVINGGCFGNLNDEYDTVKLVGTPDDDEPQSFQVFISKLQPWSTWCAS